jgi:hypothetical protein
MPAYIDTDGAIERTDATLDTTDLVWDDMSGYQGLTALTLVTQ